MYNVQGSCRKSKNAGFGKNTSQKWNRVRELHKFTQRLRQEEKTSPQKTLSLSAILQNLSTNMIISIPPQQEFQK